MKMDDLKVDIADAKRMLRNGLGGMNDFCRTYVFCVDKYGDVARSEFAAEFPCFGDREWKRFEMVGTGEMRPEFLFRSDVFVGKLMRRNDSSLLQETILHNTPEGSAEVSRNINKTRRVKLGPPWKVVGKGHAAHIHVRRVCDLGILDIERMRRELEVAMKEV